MKHRTYNVNTGHGKYSSKYPLSGLLVCGKCGAKLRRFARKDGKGQRVATWICVTHQKDRKLCEQTPIKETAIYEAYKKAVAQLMGSKDEVVDMVMQNVIDELRGENTESLDKIRDELVELRKGVLELFQKKRRGEVNQKEYDAEYGRLCVRILELEEDENFAKVNVTESQLKAKRLEDAQTLLMGAEKEITDEQIMQTLLACIKVNGKHELEFQFKSGVNIIQKI